MAAAALEEDVFGSSEANDRALDPALSLWYDRPAKEWLEALPVGNGRLGAMVFGGIFGARLQLNEGTVWAGGPHDYANPDGPAALPEIRRLVFAGEWEAAQRLAEERFGGKPMRQAPYQTVGDLNLTFPNIRTEATGYRRFLDLNRAVQTTEYTVGGVRHTREVFASFPDQVIVVRLTADKPGQVSFSADFSSPMQATALENGPDTIALAGISSASGGTPGAVRFTALARAKTEGGAVTVDGSKLTVTGANAVTLLISMASSYRNYEDVSADAEAAAAMHLEAASKKTFDRLRADHIADYRKMFERVRITLGGSPESARRPTNERVRAFGDGTADPGLVALHFQYGRYLLISCSREGGQAATLQGLWNDSLTPPWGSKYTININTEMNYWPAGPANLLDTYGPLFALISDIAVTGRRTAQTHWGAKRGWVCHHNTDAWRGTAPVDPAFYGQWPMGGAWLCKSLWDHWEYTGDRDALRRHFPLMKGAAEFFLETMVEEPTHKWLVVCPANSPEKSHHPNASIAAGPTMSNQIVRDLFDACIAASTILQTDADFRAEVTAARARLAPMQIGKAGQLQEWLEDWDVEAPDPQHRHISHLYGLHPSAQITRRGTPDLFAAARKTLEMRGDLATGWSLAWKINFWARMEDGNRAYKLITDLITPDHTAPNLFDLHPPFQIDGNFGAVSGVCEMLLQSHSGELHLLPALPSALPEGSVTGLLARGGATVGLAWKNGKLAKATIVPKYSGPVRFRLGETVITREGQAGKSFSVTATDF